MVNSYDRTALLPKVGSRWVWEIDKAHARCLLEVKEVVWNGEEWWVTTDALLPDALSERGETAWNELTRFWEAVTPVGGSKHGLTKRRAIPEPVPEVKGS